MKNLVKHAAFKRLVAGVLSTAILLNGLSLSSQATWAAGEPPSTLSGNIRITWKDTYDNNTFFNYEVINTGQYVTTVEKNVWAHEFNGYSAYHPGQYVTARCESGHSYLAPEPGATAWFSASLLTPTAYDKANNRARYQINGDVPFGGSYQAVTSTVFYISWTYITHGQVRVQLSSANPTITDGNNNYSLAGAQYGVWSTAAQAAAGGVAGNMATLTTNAAGLSNYSPELLLGTYYIKQLVAPEGYLADNTIISVSLTSSNYLITKQLTAEPLVDLGQNLVQKIDARTGVSAGIDDPTGLTLAGAEFTISFWVDYYDTIDETTASDTSSTASTAITPNAVWTLLTEAGGSIDFGTAQFKAGSSPFYLNSSGDRVIPLGTITIKETAAPPGYLLPEPNLTDLLQVKAGANGAQEWLVTSVEIAHAPYTWLLRTDRANQPLRKLEVPHELIISKTDAETGELVDDTEFTLYKNTGDDTAPLWTETVSHITGTQDIDQDANNSADSGQVLFSPISEGNYKVIETRPNVAYQSAQQQGTSEQYITIDKSTTILELSFSNYKLQTIETLKIDIDTQLPVADTEFTLSVLIDSAGETKVTNNLYEETDTAADISAFNPNWVLVSKALAYDELGNVITAGTSQGTEAPLLDTQITGDDGLLVFADLPFGYYKIEESRPNADYATLVETEGEQMAAGNAHLLVVDANYTGELEVFHNMKLNMELGVPEIRTNTPDTEMNSAEIGDILPKLGGENYALLAAITILGLSSLGVLRVMARRNDAKGSCFREPCSLLAGDKTLYSSDFRNGLLSRGCARGRLR